MDLLRESFEKVSDLVRSNLEQEFSYFDVNGIKQVNWEKVQHELTRRSKIFNNPVLAYMLLTHSDVQKVRQKEKALGRRFELSNAAGMNKLGAIPPRFLYNLGFDRVQIGTVTGKPWGGTQNVEGGRIFLSEEEKNAYNCLGLPGDGPQAVSNFINSYDTDGIPIDINYMATPDSSFTLEDRISDIKHILNILRGDSKNFILNWSCPNTEESHRNKELFELLKASRDVIGHEDLKIKLGPLTTYDDAREIMGGVEYEVSGFVLTNTDPSHGRKIRTWPISGGLSGEGLKEKSLKIHEMVSDINLKEFEGRYKLIGCGGVSSVEDLRERADIPNTIGCEIYTRLMFNGGFRALREMKTGSLDLDRRLS